MAGMKTTNNFYYMFLAFIFLCIFMYCGGNGSADNSDKSDTATATRIDSVNATIHDPASATTTPPVTGSQTDSSRTKDSAKSRKQ